MFQRWGSCLEAWAPSLTSELHCKLNMKIKGSSKCQIFLSGDSPAFACSSNHDSRDPNMRAIIGTFPRMRCRCAFHFVSAWRAFACTVSCHAALCSLCCCLMLVSTSWGDVGDHCTCAKLETAVLYAVVNFASVCSIVDMRGSL